MNENKPLDLEEIHDMGVVQGMNGEERIYVI